MASKKISSPESKHPENSLITGASYTNYLRGTIFLLKPEQIYIIQHCFNTIKSYLNAMASESTQEQPEAQEEEKSPKHNTRIKERKACDSTVLE